MRKFLTTALVAMAVTFGYAAALPVGAGTAVAEESGREDFDAAVRVIGKYWDDNFTEIFGYEYRAPAVHGVIDPETPTHCGGMVDENAIYCPRDHSLQFGSDLMEIMADDLGDASIYTVVAHEWGHAILHQVYSEERLRSAQELAADCIAGGTLGDLARDGVLIVEDDDAADLARTWEYLDAPGSDHGSKEERSAAFEKGWDGGPAACVSSSEMK